MLAPGELLVLSEVLADDEYRATRFYREWLRPRELHHLVSIIVSRTPKHITGLSLLRRPEKPPFAQPALELLQRLLPHLQRVVELQEMLIASDRKAELADRVLESLRCGAILLDDAGRVASANWRAAGLLERGEGLGLERGRLRAEDPRETTALRRLVQSAVGGASARAGGVLAVSRSDRRHALIVSVSPLHTREEHVPWLPAAGALVLLSDPEDLPPLHEAALRQLYGFTQAEARVAARIAQGETVDEIARSLGIGRATVRSQLQHALAKTGTRRQAELVRLLLMGTGALAD
jgi:DNA-binding CsgD family transcriptional regulator